MSVIQVDESDRASEHFVGETAALNRKLRRTKGAKFPVLYSFEDESALFDAEEKLVKGDEKEQALISARVAYQKYWGAVKRQEINAHLDKGHDLCRMCFCCLCGKGQFRCFCADGKKMLSPNRIVFKTSHEAYVTRNLIWEVGVGFVPKKHPETAPDWRSVKWD